jgi:hypothetical protein
MGALGIRRMMIGRLRNARGFPVVVARATFEDGREVRVMLPPVGQVVDAVNALLTAWCRGEA